MTDDMPVPLDSSPTILSTSEATAKVKATKKRIRGAKASAERTQRISGLFVIEISQIVNDLDLLLDEFEVQDNKRDRHRLLERSVLLSIRGLKILLQEPLIERTDEYFETMPRRLNDNEWAAREELRHDSTTLRLFLAAECRLLGDLGVSDDAVDRIRGALERAIWEASEDRESLENEMRPRHLREQMFSLIEELTGELNRLYDDTRHKKLIARLTGVFETLAGALIIAGNAAVGAAGTPVTAGLSVVGAAVSTAAGTEVISRGIDRAKS
jgi:hypothetical protein